MNQDHCQCLFCQARRFLVRAFKIGRAGKVSAQVQDIQPRTPESGIYGDMAP